MDTLTLFAEHQEKLAEVISELNNYSQSMWQDDAAKKRGLKATVELGEVGKKLAKCLQDDNEELNQSKARIRGLEDRLETIYRQIEHVWESPKDRILSQLDNVKGDICVTLGRPLSDKFKSTRLDKEDGDE